MVTTAQLDEQIAKLKKRKQRLLQRESAARRKRDTRAKIVLGGAVIALLKQEPEIGRRVIAQLAKRMTERDKQALRDWNNDQNGL